MREPRTPAVAGRFYPADPQRLAQEVGRYLRDHVRDDGPPAPATALIGPHAGYVYSGAILGRTYARVRVPDRVIIMCPNHTGRGARRSLWSGGPWVTPAGDIAIDDELAVRCRDEANLEPDRAAHHFEHAIEVHLPFLHASNPDARIVPIVLAGLDVDACKQVGEGLARAIKQTEGDVLLVASTDMSHYLSATEAEPLDRMALDRIEAMDPTGLHDTVRKHDISMCGYIPTTCALFAAKALGASSASLVQYGNSGDAFGDYDRVVGYAGLTVQ